MPIQQTYYLNGPSLASATGVFVNTGLTICAPDGYYSDGTIVREQVGCILYPPTECPACALSCNSLASYDGDGFGNFSINLGSPDSGAIVVTVTLNNDIPIGIIGEYNGMFYNDLSSPLYGFLSGTYTSRPTYIGTTAQGTICTLSNKNILVQDYFWNGAAFGITGTSQYVQALAGQLDLTAANPTTCVLVIPKPPGGPDNYSINIVGLCGGGDWTITASCPQVLPRIVGGPRKSDPTELPCVGIGTYNEYYIASVNGTYPVVGLYDWVFTDPWGSGVAADGWYKIGAGYYPGTDSIMQVQDGVIIQLTDCICDPFTGNCT